MKREKYTLTDAITYQFHTYGKFKEKYVYVVFELAGACVDIGSVSLDDFEKSIIEQRDGRSKYVYALNMSFCANTFSFGCLRGSIEVPCTEHAFLGFCKTALAFCKEVRTC